MLNSVVPDVECHYASGFSRDETPLIAAEAAPTTLSFISRRDKIFMSVGYLTETLEVDHAELFRLVSHRWTASGRQRA
ncbi:hypothetical protein [Methylomonas sp. UP202]|uniref:hypothetical protein n=1 Tax=Methylomonas sp. UP202 TaxID=3040943 RepID=UPI0024787AC6|nr:hypothetical protein [Methylomonas sp. UP202]WGS84644.1 hypothetical protein QC632_16475 [Methylomonas sp. UP202]